MTHMTDYGFGEKTLVRPLVGMAPIFRTTWLRCDNVLCRH